MPTVIDSLVVELGLDPKKFTKGQREALEAFKKTREEARRGAKETEDAAQRTANVASTLQRQALTLFSAFLGGRGLKDFVAYLTTTDAALGRTSVLLQTSTKTLSAWQGAAVRGGGTAEGFTASVQGLVQQFQTFALTGESSVIPYFRALGVNISDLTTGKMRPFEEIMLDLADAFQKLEPARAATFGRALGFDEGTINLLIKGRAAMKGLVRDQKELTEVTEQQAAAAAALQESWRKAEQSATSLGRTVLTALTPALIEATDRWTTIFTELNKGVFISPNSLLGWLLGRSGSQGSPAGTPAGAPAAPAGLRLKAGATGGGGASLGLLALASSLQSDIPGLKQFTALNDAYHAGTKSKHAQGLALDFTVDNQRDSAASAQLIRAKLAAMGVDATVIDEYLHPSKGSTGGHIHVQFNNAAAAARYSELSAGARGGASAGSVSNRTSSSEVSIGTVVVNTQATDADGVARGIGQAIERSSFATQAQSGPE